MTRSAAAPALLFLILFGGTALAAESSGATAAPRGCPSETAAAPADAGGTPLTATAPTAPPALKPSGDASAAESAPAPRVRSRGAAWHSFLPGMFK